jgi:flagellin-specific chaperone FliS
MTPYSDGAARYRQATMLSESPTIMWIVRGWRGVRTYLLRAARAAEQGDLSGKIAALQKSSELLAFLYRLTPKGNDAKLGAAIAGVYRQLHCLIALANAKDDAASLREISEGLAYLENIVLKAHDAAGAGS